VLPAALVDVFEAVRRQLDDHTHAPLQAVLADFIDGGHFAAHLRRMRALYAGRRDALERACMRALPPFARLGPLDAGMTAALHLPARMGDRAAAARAATQGLVTMPLSRYAAEARVNGLLLGYAALDARRIAAGVSALARVLRA
jgi:GntR family transcriptional regulator/MocR family aminotransferase